MRLLANRNIYMFEDRGEHVGSRFAQMHSISCDVIWSVAPLYSLSNDAETCYSHSSLIHSLSDSVSMTLSRGSVASGFESATLWSGTFFAIRPQSGTSDVGIRRGSIGGSVASCRLSTRGWALRGEARRGEASRVEMKKSRVRLREQREDEKSRPIGCEMSLPLCLPKTARESLLKTRSLSDPARSIKSAN
ncbi:unnamed protein product [Protopolystoma xenopodis]|uniref:Uncharacterized protein n=1 Tax=Protopolystoma xenopodis TaxID=117903 RepID=A0A3S5BCI0_9PLAT|nr:unnamed protein product [Protopolystoma xenopodis]